MTKNIEVNKVYDSFAKSKSRYLVYYGGAGSGKSVAISTKIMMRLCSEKHHKILVVRKVATTIKESVFAEFLSRIDEWNLHKHVTINKSDYSIVFDNGNKLLFKGLDEPEKIKSISKVSSIWAEEATEFSEYDFDQLILRVRGISPNYKQFITSFNPIDENHWLKKRLIDSKKSNIEVLHTTYLDNRFLDDEYKEYLNELKETNPLYYQVYCLGEWGVVDSSGKFLYSFDAQKHVGETVFNPKLSVNLSFDFNLEPFTVSAYQMPNEDTVHFIDKIRLNNSDIYQVCDVIKAKYPKSFFQVTGDSSGKNRTGTQRGKISYWAIIKQELGLHGAQIRLRSMNIGLIESRVLCNSALLHKTILIDPKLNELIDDCKYAKVDDKGILTKDRNSNKNDDLDGFRYALDCEFPELSRNPKNVRQ